MLVSRGKKMKGFPALRFAVWMLLLFFIIGCHNQITQIPTTQSTTVRVLSARAYLQEALELGQQWRDDAELKEIQAHVFSSTQSDPLDATFRFHSPSEDHLIYTVMCFSNGCVGKEFTVSKVIGFGSIEFENEMIDSIEAAGIALQNGGDGFLRSRDATIWVRLGRDNPRDVGPTVWLAYHAMTGKELGVVIDPYTGEVIRVE